MKFSVIGCGYWGPNYIRAINEVSGANVKSCCDLDSANLDRMKSIHRGIRATKDFREVLKDKETEAVVITTPPETHFRIARECLLSGKNVLVEKPLVTSYEDGKELLKISEETGKKLMVGHIYIFNPGIRHLKAMVDNKEFGDIFYLDSLRVGLGPIRKNASVIWDLAIHDIYISMFLLQSEPRLMAAVGGDYIKDGIEDMVNLTLKFDDKILHNIHVSWFSPEKIRKMNIVGSKKMAAFDDVNKSETVKIYEREIDKKMVDSTPEYKDHQSIVSVGNVYVPEIPQSEPLKNQIIHFMESIKENREPLTGGKEGLKAVRVAEAAEKILRERNADQ